MGLELEINNVTDCFVRKTFFFSVAEKTLKMVDEKFFSTKKICISVAFVSEGEIAALNKQYRKKNSATDILSFCEYDKIEEVKKNKDKKVFLGELIVCPEDIKKYAKKNNLCEKSELARVFSHGVLHLLGFSHGKKMFAIQEKIVTNM